MSVVDDVQTRLASQSLVDGSTGWPSSRRMVHDETDKLVVITEDGGPPPEIAAGTGIGDSARGDVGVHVLVRGEPGDGDASAAKAQAILDDLHSVRDTTIGATSYGRVRALTPEPVFAGYDEKHRPQHTVAFRMLRDI